jgi:hypothetical protein
MGSFNLSLPWTIREVRMTSRNQGEGDKESALRYDKEQEAFTKSGKVEKGARDAGKALDGPEAEELREAEQEGRSKSKG